jgi:hypothetical protein
MHLAQDIRHQAQTTLWGHVLYIFEGRLLACDQVLEDRLKWLFFKVREWGFDCILLYGVLLIAPTDFGGALGLGLLTNSRMVISGTCRW